MSMPLPYEDLAFPEPPDGRPYVFVNMVSTIDGKILSGERDENVMDLGSENDHAVMRRIEAAADAVIVGAGSLRATKGLWYPKELIRIVVSGSGKLPYDGRFFTDAPESAFVCTDVQIDLPNGVRTLPADLKAALRALRNDHGVRLLLCEGGSELNASMFRLGLIDEIFLTLAPKIKLGRDVPTIADGEPFRREELQHFDLLEVTKIEDELFLRYRRKENRE